jgi:signal transduction histidine kinase
MQMDLPEDEKIMRYSDAIRTATERIAHLTSQLLAYGQGGKYYPRVICLSDFARDTLAIVRHNIDPAIVVDTDLAHDLPKVKADLTQMQLVLTTLLNNASEGIESRGHIKVVTSHTSIDKEITLAHPDVQPGPYVCLTVEDTGIGMDDETRAKIFEPFFSTKFHGRGLAMAAVYGVVRNHGGFILVDSRVGSGTVVRVYFPVVDGEENGEQ